MANINYAVDYSKALANAFPYSLYFGCCYTSPNNQTYRWTGAKTIEIPTITTTGRVDSNRDTIGSAARNYDNAWETKVLSNQRKWSTLVHPADIDQTNQVASIANITQTYNEQQKFPEMDAYCISKLYSEWTGQSKTATAIALTEDNVLDYFDTLMENMDENRVPPSGRVLHVTPAINKLIKNASQLTRYVNADGNGGTVNRKVSRIDEVEINVVPSNLMKTVYDFTAGWAVGVGAKQIQMCLMHPLAVITPFSYQFAQLDDPSAKTEGKYLYFEESFEDIFILNQKADALQFVIEPTA